MGGVSEFFPFKVEVCGFLHQGKQSFSQQECSTQHLQRGLAGPAPCCLHFPSSPPLACQPITCSGHSSWRSPEQIIPAYLGHSDTGCSHQKTFFSSGPHSVSSCHFSNSVPGSWSNFKQTYWNFFFFLNPIYFYLEIRTFIPASFKDLKIHFASCIVLCSLTNDTNPFQFSLLCLNYFVSLVIWIPIC